MSKVDLMANEIWKDVDGYEGLYQVSSLSRVKSLKRKINVGNNGWRVLPDKIMKPSVNLKNAVFFSLCKNGKFKTNLLHRLVAKAFIPNPNNKRTINHKDGSRLNNNIENLEWATYSENWQHAIDTGFD